VLLALFSLAACDPVGDRLNLIYFDSDRDPGYDYLHKPGSDTSCYAEFGATLTVLKVYSQPTGCNGPRADKYYLEYSTDGAQEFRTRYGQLPKKSANGGYKAPCANRTLVVLYEQEYDYLLRRYENFLEYEEKKQREAAFEKQVIEEQRRKNQVEKE